MTIIRWVLSRWNLSAAARYRSIYSMGTAPLAKWYLRYENKNPRLQDKTAIFHLVVLTQGFHLPFCFMKSVHQNHRIRYSTNLSSRSNICKVSVYSAGTRNMIWRTLNKYLLYVHCTGWIQNKTASTSSATTYINHTSISPVQWQFKWVQLGGITTCQ